MVVAVAILRLPEGLDYSGMLGEISDDDSGEENSSLPELQKSVTSGRLKFKWICLFPFLS
jgi:hypothetical protein